jgi:hypothetical protein
MTHKPINNKLRLITRFILPLLVLGISWCIDWLYNFIVYGGFEQMYKAGLVDDSSVRANHLFMGLFYLFLLPAILFIHAIFCKLNNDHNFINRRFAVIVTAALTIALCFGCWTKDTSRNIENIIGILCSVSLPTLLYFYGLNFTKKRSKSA